MSSEMLDMFVQSFWETLVMVGISGLVGAALGMPLGVLLYLTDRDGVLRNLAVNRVLGGAVNAVRSTPFIILLVAVIPFTRLVVGSSIGTAAAVVPLTIAAAPFIARLVETALREVDRGLIEAAQAMGATTQPDRLQGAAAGIAAGRGGGADASPSCRSSAIRRWRARSAGADSATSASAMVTSASCLKSCWRWW